MTTAIVFSFGFAAGVLCCAFALFVVGSALSAYPYNEDQQGYDERVCKAGSERA